MSRRGWAAVAGLVALRLWLTSALPLQVISGAGYDDRLFVEHAAQLAAGRWLGTYGMLTLSKGPFYSMWIAALHALGLPLLFTRHLLYAAACGVLVLALRPLLRGPAFALGLFALLLFNPALYHGEAMRVCRDGIYPSWTLLTLAGAIGLVARAEREPRRLATWAATLGFGLGALWLTREEGLWIVPALVLLGAVGVLAGRKRRPRRAAAVAWGGGLALAAAMVLAVALVNLSRYGTFAVTDVRSGQFARAFGSLMRVEDPAARPFVAVSRATRERLYAVSPSFAELRRWLEGPSSRIWIVATRDALGGEQQGEIGTGWFFWAFRTAVDAAGYYRDPAAAAGFYRRVADEIGAACDAGRLACTAPRASVVPPWRREYLPRIVRSLGRGTVALTSFARFHADVRPSTLQPRAGYELFRNMVGGEFSPPASAPQRREGLRMALLRATGAAYRLLTPWLAVVSLAAGAVAVGCGVAARRVTPPAWVVGALAAAIATRLALLAYIEVTSFPAMNILYLAPLFPLLLLACALGLHEGVRARRRGSAA